MTSEQKADLENQMQ